MSIRIGYRFANEWTPAASRIQLERASEADLRYDLFTGDLELEVSGKDFSARWGWIPLIDSAECLDQVAADFRSGHTSSFIDFTEADDKLNLNLDQGKVIVTATYCSGSANCTLAEFMLAVPAFKQQLARDILQRHPRVESNAAFRRLMR